MKINLSKTKILRVVKSTSFSKGYVLALAMIIPIAISQFFGQLSLGIAITVGVLLCSPSDVPGNLRHRFFGMLFSIGFAFVATMIGGYTEGYPQWQIPILAVLIFFISYISVYGFRASLVSFAGLLATVLSFANLGAQSVFDHSLLIIAGGIWYILISTFFLFLRPKKHTDLLLGETLKLTADFLTLRERLISDKNNRKKLQVEQFNLQTQLNEKHESLREALISSRKQSGIRNSSKRKLLIFIDLVDILELGLTHPVILEKVEELSISHPELLEDFKALIHEMGGQLQNIAEVLIDGKELVIRQEATEIIEKIEAYVDAEFEENASVSDRELLAMIQNTLIFDKKQLQKIKSIERLLSNDQRQKKLIFKTKNVHRFLTPTDYSFKVFKENFTFQSPFFRHALRLTFLMIVGILIGKLFAVQNAYWIILTVVVIMRPGYGLTKERTKKRILGTLIGGVLAAGIIFFIHSTIVYAILGIISLIAAFTMIQKNYVGGATFITLMVAFVYALLRPDAFVVIQYRMIDTGIGAALAVVGNVFLWPSWEYREITKSMTEMLQANIAYFQEIIGFYKKGGKLPSNYKLTRKQAFLKMGNLSAAFQRMAQEPKSKQKDFRKVYEFTVLNQTFLSSLASLGTFIRSQKTHGDVEYFETYSSEIIQNLQQEIKRIEGEEFIGTFGQDSLLEQADKELKRRSVALNDLKMKQSKSGEGDQNISKASLQEEQLISGQLRWLYEVSLNLQKIHSKTNK